MKIAYVCYYSEGKYPQIEKENEDLLNYLKQRGLDIRKVIWDDPEVNWQHFNLVVLKAPWDYFDKFKQFREWLMKLEQLRVRVLNPVPVVRWNSDKHYLQDIEEAGLNIIPSLFIEKGELPPLEDFFVKLRSETLIIKPAVSGGAKNTILLTLDTLPALSEGIQKMLLDEDFVVQPFIKEIQTEGEWSLVFFGGQYSHCILKTAAPDDFRVQEIHGGSVHPLEASPELIATARQYVEKFADGCLYARVDGVIIAGNFYLMELELIEPYLYLSSHPEGLENYYRALEQML